MGGIPDSAKQTLNKIFTWSDFKNLVHHFSVDFSRLRVTCLPEERVKSKYLNCLSYF